MIFSALQGLPLHRVLARTVKEFLDDEMSTYASALAYQALFSLFPFLLFLIALIGFLHLPDFFSWLRLQSELVLPPQALEQVNPVIDQLQQSKGGLLSVGIVIALAGRFGSASRYPFSTPWAWPACCWQPPR